MKILWALIFISAALIALGKNSDADTVLNEDYLVDTTTEEQELWETDDIEENNGNPIENQIRAEDTEASQSKDNDNQNGDTEDENNRSQLKHLADNTDLTEENVSSWWTILFNSMTLVIKICRYTYANTYLSLYFDTADFIIHYSLRMNYMLYKFYTKEYVANEVSEITTKQGIIGKILSRFCGVTDESNEDELNPTVTTVNQNLDPQSDNGFLVNLLIDALKITNTFLQNSHQNTFVTTSANFVIKVVLQGNYIIYKLLDRANIAYNENDVNSRVKRSLLNNAFGYFHNKDVTYALDPDQSWKCYLFNSAKILTFYNLNCKHNSFNVKYETEEGKESETANPLFSFVKFLPRIKRNNIINDLEDSKDRSGYIDHIFRVVKDNLDVVGPLRSWKCFLLRATFQQAQDIVDCNGDTDAIEFTGNSDLILKILAGIIKKYTKNNRYYRNINNDLNEIQDTERAKRDLHLGSKLYELNNKLSNIEEKAIADDIQVNKRPKRHIIFIYSIYRLYQLYKYLQGEDNLEKNNPKVVTSGTAEIVEEKPQGIMDKFWPWKGFRATRDLNPDQFI